MDSIQNSRRRFLKLGAASVSAGLSACSIFKPSWPGEQKQTVLACADIHIGYSENGGTGVIWFQDALSDIDKIERDISFAVVLGDIAHNAKPDEFESYSRIRNASTIDEWYELAGNHDWNEKGLQEYKKHVSSHLTYLVIDGNCLWIFLSDEAESTRGEISKGTYLWLNDIISKHGENKNVIVCSHQLVPGTVENPDNTEDRYLYMGENKASELSQLPVDLWMCGHEHHYPWKEKNIYYNGRTTFINIASLSYAYSTGQSNSFILEFNQNDKHIKAYRRIHNEARTTTIFNVPVSFPVDIGQSSQRTLINS